MSTAHLTEVLEQITEAVGDLNAVELAEALADVARVQARAAEARKVIEAALVALGEPVEHPVYGRFWLDRTTDRKQWQHNRVANALADVARTERRYDGSTGEVESEAEAVQRVLMEAAGISYWKLTALRARGLDPDAFCTVEERTKVVLPEGAKP